jgi:NADPH-dependent F420 reductase
MRISVLGGTGPAGGALALRLADVGHDVTVGSRAAERADQAVEELLQRWPGRSLSIRGGGNEDAAASAEMVVVATPWDGAASTAAAVADALAGKVVISMANALTRLGSELVALVPPRGSVAAAVQAAAPEALVAAAFHHVPAHELADLDHPVDCDVIVCADRPEAARLTAELVDSIPDLRALRAGSLSAAAATEAFTAVLLQVNRRYKTRSTIRLHGIDTSGSS